jgi:hypothetical protein
MRIFCVTSVATRLHASTLRLLDELGLGKWFAEAPPRGVRLVSRARALRRLAGYLVAIGPMPEHAPGYARR